MGQNQRHSKACASYSYSKGIKAFAISLIALVLSGCQTPPQRQDTFPKKIKAVFQHPKEGNITQVTFLGFSMQGSFSKDGNSVLFTSSNRDNHSTFQIYFKDLTSSHIRRVTFNGGDNYFPIFDPTNEYILYMSDTDYLKEVVDLSRVKKQIGLGTNTLDSSLFDIYYRKFTQTLVQRITKKSSKILGFEFNDLKKIFVTTKTNSKITNHTIRLRNRTKTKSNIHLRDLSQSQNKWLAGVNKNNQLVILNHKGKQVYISKPEDGTLAHPSWHPDNKKIAVVKVQGKSPNIFVYHLPTQCFEQITYHSSTEKDPAFHPDGKKILFTSDRIGQDQLFLMDLPTNGPCGTSKNSI